MSIYFVARQVDRRSRPTPKLAVAGSTRATIEERRIADSAAHPRY